MLLSISVDLDQVDQYREIHGLPGGDARELIYSRAVPRLVEWARQRRVALTWFVIGRDAEHPPNVQTLAKLAASGDELACHSYSHPYDLTRLSASSMRSQIDLGVAALQRATGTKVVGFRAPGYIVNDTLLALVREAGLAYDSSVFPCPSYYVLKAGAIAGLAMTGRRSKSVLDTPQMLQAPTAPYRVGRPYWQRGTGILEIPIQVTRRARLPFIGTALTMAGPTGARLLARGVMGEPFVNLELHGIDALDEADGLSDLAKHQRDLRIPWTKKLDAIDAAVSLLRSKGYSTVRMDELAARARNP